MSTDLGLYEQVLEGTSNLTPGGLFELASRLARAGHQDKKMELYDIIFDHPDASADDLAQVLIARHDWVRRQGEPLTALDALDGMQLTEEWGVLTQAMYWQAVGQCYLKQIRGIGPAGRCYVAAAVWAQQHIFDLDGYDRLPVDKRLYFRESIIGMMVTLRKFDEDLAVHFEEYIRDLGLLPPGSDDRAFGMLLKYKGEGLRHMGQFVQAAQKFHKAMGRFPSRRDQAMMAMLGIVSIVDGELEETFEGAIDEFLSVFREYYKEITKTDKQEYPREWLLACKRAGVEERLEA